MLPKFRKLCHSRIICHHGCFLCSPLIFCPVQNSCLRLSVQYGILVLIGMAICSPAVVKMLLFSLHPNCESLPMALAKEEAGKSILLLSHKHTLVCEGERRKKSPQHHHHDYKQKSLTAHKAIRAIRATMRENLSTSSFLLLSPPPIAFSAVSAESWGIILLWQPWLGEGGVGRFVLPLPTLSAATTLDWRSSRRKSPSIPSRSFSLRPPF